MSILIAVAYAVAYAIGWLLTAVLAMRWLADNWGYCHSSRTYRSTCVAYHGRDCWRSDGEITPRVTAAGCGIALAWPLLLAPGAAYWLATRKPTAVGQARRIEELERQLGMEERR